jgi:putative transposase
MPLRLERRYGQHDFHFITFSCYRRLPLLGSARARDVLVEVLGKVRGEFGVKILGYVVMPEHVHLLIDETPASTPSRVLQVLKQRVSKILRKEDRELRAPAYFCYMHMNPIERGLVQHPKEWPWSSYSFYFRSGPVLLPMDKAE